MKPIEIIDIIKTESPKLLGNIPDKKAANIIRAALSHIAQEVAALDEGQQTTVLGLGVFRARKAAVEKDGQKATVRRVLFSIPKPVAKQELSGGAESSGGVEAVATPAKKTGRK